MPEPGSTTYDAVPYPSVPFVQTHPDRLATVATLFGMNPPPPDVRTCRVLELGCAQGDNLIPLALELPDAQFVGLDLSARQVEAGRAAAAELGVRNLRLLHQDLRDVPADLGTFDYIIAHGVYSWVPPEARDAILAICRRHLAPNGVTYVSYNTLPGWRLSGLVREILFFHLRRVEDPQERVRQSRALLDFMGRAIPEPLQLYRKIFTEVGERLAGERADVYLYHEYLEEVNDPVYFQQFVAHAARHGLRFLAEAEISTMQIDGISPEAARTVGQFGEDLVEREQYIDFLTKRTFRQSLLCHSGAQSRDRLVPDRVRGLHVASELRPAEPPGDLRDTRMVRFGRSSGTGEMATDHPLTKAALLHLADLWPATLPFAELEVAARARLVPNALVVQPAAEFQQDTRDLAENLLHACRADLLELHAHPPRFALQAGERPLASPWARRQAALGRAVTNLRHAGVKVNDSKRRLIALLDGTRDREQIVEALAAQIERDDCVVVTAGRPAQTPAAVRAAIAGHLDDTLRELTRQALLVA